MLGIKSEVRPTGIFGFTDSVDLAGYGIVAYGGESQRGAVMLSVNGAGCARIASFQSVRAFLEPLGAKITRLDIAADDIQGEFLTVRKAINAWRRGEFKTGGNPPKARLVDDMGSGEGKTFYVGSRAGGKLCRVYEKGKALGELASKWVRGEVELHSKDRVIPWDAVTEPGRFLAGAYPFFSAFSYLATRIATFKKGAQVALDKASAWAKVVVGRTVNVLLKELQGDCGAVVACLRRSGVPRSLHHWFSNSRHRLEELNYGTV